MISDLRGRNSKKKTSLRRLQFSKFKQVNLPESTKNRFANNKSCKHNYFSNFKVFEDLIALVRTLIDVNNSELRFYTTFEVRR
jgi:hypothetical protein